MQIDEELPIKLQCILIKKECLIKDATFKPANRFLSHILCKVLESHKLITSGHLIRQIFDQELLEWNHIFTLHYSLFQIIFFEDMLDITLNAFTVHPYVLICNVFLRFGEESRDIPIYLFLLKAVAFLE